MNYLELKKKALHLIVGKVKGFVRSVIGVPPIALEACADNMSIIDYKIHGNSIQDGTPSPDNPIEVQSVGELVTDETDVNYGKYKIPVTARSKNLFDISKANDINNWPYISETGDAGRYIIPLENGKTYTLMCNRMVSVETMGSKGYNIYNNGKAIYTKTTGNAVIKFTCNNTFLDLYIPGVNGLKNNHKTLLQYFQLMIVEGEYTATTIGDYEPYHEPTTTNIYLDEPLRKVGNYADYIDFKNGMVVRNIANKVFNGTEHWGESGYNSQITINYMQFWTDYIRNKALDSIILSNLLESTKSSNWSNLSLEKEFILITTTGDIGIKLSKDRVASVEELKNLLSNNNMSVYFVSNTPTETPISLPILPTFKGITTVYEVGTTIQPSNMEAEYYSTLKGE